MSALKNIHLWRVCLFATLVLSSVPMQALSDTTRAPASEPLEISVGEMPVMAMKLDDPMPSMVRRIVEVAGAEANISIYPFKRSMEYIAQGITAAHWPVIYSPEMDKLDLPYVFSTTSVSRINFVLYSNKGADVDINRIEDFQILTERGIVDLFDFDIEPSSNLLGAIHMVDSGRIDGYIFAGNTVDPIVIEKGYTNIKRTLFARFDIRAVIARTDQTEQIDAMFTRGILKMKSTGELDEFAKLMSVKPYDDWQP